MIDKNSFDGGLVYGPKAFAEKTGRNKVWSAPAPPLYELAGRSCPNCGRLDAELLFYTKPRGGDLNVWDYHCCKACQMVYTRMAPTPKALAQMYGSGPSQQEWVKLQQNELEAGLDAAKFRWALEKAGWPFGNRRILDIGCSTGSMLVVADIMARPHKRFLGGVEINSAALQTASARVGGDDFNCSVVIHDKLEVMKYLYEECVPFKFDVVVLWEVLEHVLDPKTMLAEAWELLAPGGIMILCVPNWNSLAVRIMRERATCFGAGHLNFWCAETLLSLIQRTLTNNYDTRWLETIVSYAKELTNYLNFREPMSEDVGDPSLMLPPVETIHRLLMGYKLVAWVRKGEEK